MYKKLTFILVISLTKQYIDLTRIQQDQNLGQNNQSQQNNESSQNKNSDQNDSQNNNLFPENFPLQPNTDETPLNECDEQPKVDLLKIFSDLPVESIDCDVEYLQFQQREMDLKILMYLQCYTVSKNLVSDMNLWLRVEGEVENEQLKKGKIPFDNKYFRWLVSPSEELLKNNIDQNKSLSCEQTKTLINNYLVTSDNQSIQLLYFKYLFKLFL